MRVCSTCGTENPDGARFCLSCGSSLVDACPVCGAERPEGARFCPSCGAALVEIAAPPRGRERRLVTILFADVVGSTGLGDTLDPERLQEVLGTYFDAMREVIEREGGTVEKFIGDAIMAAFGVPVAHEDDPVRALRAALGMRERLVSVNETLSERSGVTLAVRIGVNTGEVLASTNPQPGEPMVTGDVVNVAARLEQAAAADEIVVAERTARAARGFRYREVDALDLRGKEGPVAAVILEGTAPDRAERGVPGLRSPMVGRDQELALLQSVFARSVSEERASLVTIYGDPGVGKSRLVREFLGWVERQDPAPTVAFGRCLPYGDGITYWPFAEILKQHAEVQDSDPTETVRRKIDASCRAVLASDPTIDPLRAVGALAYTAGVELPEAPMSDEPRQIRAEIHLAWRSFFTALSRRGPVVAVIEDIHWADEALLDLLDELGDRVAGGVMFVCPARPELLERRAGWGGGRRNFSSVALEPLSPDDADRLVRHLLTIDDLPPTVRNRILERAEGNPFFLEEIVRHLIDDGQIVREAGRWRAQARIAEVEIPDTVQAVLAARIDILPPDDKQALQRAAVVGRVFWTGPVVRLLDGDTELLDRALDRLEDRELVASRLGSSFAGETEFSFKHVLTREVAYGSLPRRDRGRAHATVARWLEDVSAERAGEFVELLAYHYGEALRGAREDPSTAADEIERLRAKTFESLLSAAEATRRRFSIAKAFRLAEQARGLAATPLERARVLEQIGVAAISDYRGDLAWETLKEAVEIRLLHAPDDREALARVCGRAVESPTRWPGSMRTTVTEEEIERLIAIGLEHLAPDRDGEDRVRLLIARAFGPFSVGHGRHPTAEEVAVSLRAGEEAADMAVRIGRIDLASAALDATGSALLIDGMYGLQIPYIQRRIDLAPRINNPWEVGDIFAMAAWSYANIGHHRRALEYGEEGAFRAAEDAEGIRLHNLAWCACAAFHLGDWDRIIDDLFPKVDAILRDRDEPPYFVSHLYGTAQFILTAREDVRASDQVELLEEMATNHPRASVLVGWLAWIRARGGDAARAMELLSTVDAIPSSVFRPHTDLMRAGVYSDLASFDAAPAFLETTRAYAAKAGLVALPAALDALEGRMAFAAGDVQTGTTALRRARERFVELSMPFERARAELSLAEGLAASDSAEARGLLDLATREAERLGSTLELRRASDVRSRLG